MNYCSSGSQEQMELKFIKKGNVPRGSSEKQSNLLVTMRKAADKKD